MKYLINIKNFKVNEDVEAQPQVQAQVQGDDVIRYEEMSEDDYNENNTSDLKFNPLELIKMSEELEAVGIVGQDEAQGIIDIHDKELSTVSFKYNGEVVSVTKGDDDYFYGKISESDDEEAEAKYYQCDKIKGVLDLIRSLVKEV